MPRKRICASVSSEWATDGFDACSDANVFGMVVHGSFAMRLCIENAVGTTMSGL